MNHIQLLDRLAELDARARDIEIKSYISGGCMFPEEVRQLESIYAQLRALEVPA